jgi:hypothetical protein
MMLAAGCGASVPVGDYVAQNRRVARLVAANWIASEVFAPLGFIEAAPAAHRPSGREPGVNQDEKAPTGLRLPEERQLASFRYFGI